MKMMLPKKYYYNKDGIKAYVKAGKLYIKGNTIYFRKLMYDITYTLKGSKCYYCGITLTEENKTIDHMYPKCYGGINITDNLVPFCKKHNIDKVCMTYDQFKKWERINDREEKDLFFQQSILENAEIIKRKGFLIPEEWLTLYDISKYFEYVPFKKISTHKLKQMKKYYQKWQQYPMPIIVSSDGWVLEGNRIITHAKMNNIQKVYAVVLENVIVIRNSS